MITKDEPKCSSSNLLYRISFPGPSANTGLKLESFRAEDGLWATVRFPQQFQAFPGIINGGIVSVALDCHGNWSAAIALMDKAALPRPPFTLSASLQVRLHALHSPVSYLKSLCAYIITEAFYAPSVDEVLSLITN